VLIASENESEEMICLLTTLPIGKNATHSVPLADNQLDGMYKEASTLRFDNRIGFQRSEEYHENSQTSLPVFALILESSTFCISRNIN
jgi:hypothetical protein